ncbi:MAG: hypothetical protein QOK14_1384 [Frankiaceae bacterium]|jgi:preprotein translocase subunit SecY|nr:hypothetical protein [Frankiaceae bacterium]
MRGRRSIRVPAAGLLPALFVGGLTVAAPFAGTSTAVVASTHTAVKPAATAPQGAMPRVLVIDPGASQFLVQFYLGIAALATVIILFAIIWLRGAERRESRRTARAAAVWTDAPAVTARTGRSPAPAPRAAPRRSWPAASAPRG